MKLYFEKIEQAIVPILIVNWLIGLGPVQYPIGNSRREFSFIFVLLIASCYSYVSYTELFGSCTKTNANSLDYLVFTANRYLNTFTAIVSLTVGWFSRKVSVFSNQLSACVKFFFFTETATHMGKINAN